MTEIAPYNSDIQNMIYRSENKIGNTVYRSINYTFMKFTGANITIFQYVTLSHCLYITI